MTTKIVFYTDTQRGMVQTIAKAIQDDVSARMGFPMFNDEPRGDFDYPRATNYRITVEEFDPNEEPGE